MIYSPAMKRLLETMRDGIEPEDQEAVRDGGRGRVWVGLDTFNSKTLEEALRFCAVSDVSDGGGMERYALNSTGRYLLYNPSDAYRILNLLITATPFTIKDHKIELLDDPNNADLKDFI